MVFTTPTKNEFKQWVLEENEIVCQKENWDLKCMKDNREIRFSSSHFISAAVFSSYEVDYEDESGEQGIFGELFSQEEGLLWDKILN
jgi:hypothetical protein